jgi:hypothetical protein
MEGGPNAAWTACNHPSLCAGGSAGTPGAAAPTRAASACATRTSAACSTVAVTCRSDARRGSARTTGPASRPTYGAAAASDNFVQYKSATKLLAARRSDSRDSVFGFHCALRTCAASGASTVDISAALGGDSGTARSADTGNKLGRSARRDSRDGPSLSGAASSLATGVVAPVPPRLSRSSNVTCAILEGDRMTRLMPHGGSARNTGGVRIASVDGDDARWSLSAAARWSRRLHPCRNIAAPRIPECNPKLCLLALHTRCRLVCRDILRSEAISTA